MNKSMSFFGLFGKKAPIEEYLREGAVVIDVRSVDEYKGGAYQRLKKHSFTHNTSKI